MMARHRQKTGFTIVEMLMVVAVLAILMGIVTTAATAAIRHSRGRKAEAVKAVIQNGIATYRSQRDVWPPKGGILDKWSDDGLSGNQNNGVSSGRQVAFLSASQYDDMMYELARVSVGQSGASPVMDVMGIAVARRSVADSGKGRGQEFREAIKKNKKHGETLKLKEMAFGYITEKGLFRRFIVQYNVGGDSVAVLTEADYRNWWDEMQSGRSIQWPTGYTAK